MDIIKDITEKVDPNGDESFESLTDICIKGIIIDVIEDFYVDVFERIIDRKAKPEDKILIELIEGNKPILKVMRDLLTTDLKLSSSLKLPSEEEEEYYSVIPRNIYHLINTIFYRVQRKTIDNELQDPFTETHNLNELLELYAGRGTGLSLTDHIRSNLMKREFFWQKFGIIAEDKGSFVEVKFEKYLQSYIRTVTKHNPLDPNLLIPAIYLLNVCQNRQIIGEELSSEMCWTLAATIIIQYARMRSGSAESIEYTLNEFHQLVLHLSKVVHKIVLGGEEKEIKYLENPKKIATFLDNKLRQQIGLYKLDTKARIVPEENHVFNEIMRTIKQKTDLELGI